MSDQDDDQDAFAAQGDVAFAAVAKIAEWTEEDSDAARREGWDIFYCFTSPTDFQIQRLDEPGNLEPVIIANVGLLWVSDAHAHMHIWGVRSDLHAKALDFLRKVNPPEWETIKATARRQSVPYGGGR